MRLLLFIFLLIPLSYSQVQLVNVNSVMTDTKWCRYNVDRIQCDVDGFGGIGAAGALTATTVPKWDGTDLVDSIIWVTATGVGINDATPVSELQVSGTAQIITSDTTAGTGDNYLRFSRANGVTNMGYLGFDSAANDHMNLFNNLNANLTFGTNNTEKMVIEAGGDVGIGVTNPTQRLHVSGNALVTAQVWTPEICDENGNNCQDISVFGGSMAKNCAAYEVLRRNAADTDWECTSNVQSITAGAGISSSVANDVTTLNIGDVAGDGLTVNANDLQVNVTDTISINVGDQLYVTSNSLDDAEIVDNSLTQLSLAPNSVDASELVSTSVVAGSYGSATEVATFTVDTDGRLTAAGNTTITDNTGVTTLGGQTGATQTFAVNTAATASPIISSAANTHTLNIGAASSMAAGASLGLVTKTQADNWTAADTLVGGTMTTGKFCKYDGTDIDCTYDEVGLGDVTAVAETVSQGITVASSTGPVPSVGLMDCAANEVLKRNAGDTAWVCAADNNINYPSTGVVGSIQFSNGSSGFSADATNLFWDDTNNRLGIGTSNPQNLLEISNDSGAVAADISGYGSSDSDSGILNLQSANGTSGSPTASVVNNRLGAIQFKGHDGTSFTTARATIESVASENFTGTNQGSDLRFFTTSNGNVTKAIRMTILENGNVGIGTINPSAVLDVNGDVKVGDAGASCNVSNEGKMKYNSASKMMQFCNGTAWTDMGGGGIATGIVAYFNGAACPTGWTELTIVRGRYIVGLPSGGTLNGISGTALTNLESRSVGAHLHSVNPPNTATQTGGAHQHGFYSEGDAQGTTGNNRGTIHPSNTGSNLPSALTKSAGTHAHNVDIAAFNSASTGSVAGTNAPYVQLLACEKN